MENATIKRGGTSDRLRRFQRIAWVALALSLPVALFAALLPLGFGPTLWQTPALRLTVGVWVLVAVVIDLICYTFAVRLTWTVFRPQWGGRMIMLSMYGVFVPICFVPLAYLSFGSLWNAGLFEMATFTSLAVSFVLLFGGLLVALVEVGLGRSAR